MVMTYGDIDKSKERHNDLNLIITNLTKVLGLTDFAGMEETEKLIKDSLKSALKIKGDR
jgi:hypothetical protein